MTHTQEWHDERAKGIGGSDAGRIMKGDLLALWEEKTGRREPEDLTWVLPVQIGTVTEALNRTWFSHYRQPVNTDDCEHLVSLDHPFMRANLDGRCDGAIFEAKHVSAFAKEDEILSRYYPQLQHCMVVAGLPLAHLSVFYGTQKWETYEIEADETYQADLIAREAGFWRHVETDTPPANTASVGVEIALDDMREVSFAGDNEWACDAGEWLDNYEGAKKFERAAKNLKARVEPNVKLAVGYGVKVTRAKNNSLTIRAV